MAQVATENHFTITRPYGMAYIPDCGVYTYAVRSWLWGIHYADLRNFLPFRMFICTLGLLIVMLSVTGVYIWWRKRDSRRLAHLRRSIQ